MLSKLLPVLLALVGLGAGVGGGLMLRPPPEEKVAMENPCGEPAQEDKEHYEPAETGPDEQHDYVKLNNQFVIPVVEETRVGSLVVLSLSLEITPGQSAAVYEREPKLRDEFLQVLFDHANAGGFKGAFTNSTRMTVLRQALYEVARKTLGDMVTDVLIIDIIRQDA